MEPLHSTWIPADWPVPKWLRAGSTTRLGGCSQPPYKSLNLALHVGDDPTAVNKNRAHLKTNLQLPGEPFWLRQVHGQRIINLDTDTSDPVADGAYTTQANTICTVLTADCLPVLLCDVKRHKIAAIHVGWRGFSQSIIKHAIAIFGDHANEVMAWLGPCISAEHYEVGRDVYVACCNTFSDAEAAFRPSRNDHWYADLKTLATLQLQSLGVDKIFISSHCTYKEDTIFYSYRRNPTTGRMASLIWLDH